MASDLAADPHADWGDRTPVHDERGALMFVFTLAESTRSGRPWADGVWRPQGTPVEAAADLMLSALAGHAVSTGDPEIVAALTAAGASELRHAHSMGHDLERLPTVRADPRLVVERLDADGLADHADELAAISFKAYPPDHPDHEFDDVEQTVHELRGIGLGHILGPYLDVSTVALVDGQIVGACLIVDRPGAIPEGGPWIIEVFRDPDSTVKQVGSSLIAASLAAAKHSALPSVSLAVSHSNANALALYSTLGFADAAESWTLALP